MKRLIVATALCLVAAPALAYFAGTGQTADSYGNTSGGEFIFHPTSGPGPWSAHRLEAANPDFETFCIEKTEYVGHGVWFNVDIDTQAIGAIHGGPGGNGYNDPLDPRTAWLYCEFIKGQLPNYHYGLDNGGSNRAASADALQHVIWYLEGEEPKSWTDGDGSLADLFYSESEGQSSWCTRVMNLWRPLDNKWDGYGERNWTLNRWEYQSLLICVPAPAAALLGVIGVGLVGWVKRRLS